MPIPMTRRNELLEKALVLTIEVLTRLCPEGDLEDDTAVLKEMLDERNLDPKTLANLQWTARDVIDLLCGKDSSDFTGDQWQA
jgi:hypothetical protein